MAQASPSRRSLPRLLFCFLNPLVKVLLRSPLHRPLSQRLLLLTFTGRQTGKRYTTPVGYVQVGDTLLLGTQSRWWKNLRGGARISARLRGRDCTGVADVLTDEAGMIESYRPMLAVAPHNGRAIGVRLDPDGWPNRDDVARARQEGHVVIRLHLDQADQGPSGWP